MKRIPEVTAEIEEPWEELDDILISFAEHAPTFHTPPPVPLDEWDRDIRTPADPSQRITREIPVGLLASLRNLTKDLS